VHVKGIGNHHPLKSHIVPQDLLNDGRGKRGRSLIATTKGRYRKVAHHDGLHPCRYHLSKWVEFLAFQGFKVFIDYGKAEVRIGGGIAVSGKVLGTAKDPAALHALHKGYRFLRYFLFVLPE